VSVGGARTLVGILVWACLAPPAAGADPAAGRSLASDRRWDVLAGPGPGRSLRERLREAGERLADWHIHLAGVALDGPGLVALAGQAPDEPILRVARETLARPVDLEDLLYFLDDVLRAGRDEGRRGELVWVTPGRARKAGILLHPDDVFEPERPRLYGREPTIAIDQPRPQRDFPVARDGDVLGPAWTMRYRNPDGEPELLAALARQPGAGDFADRVGSLLGQLRSQGAVVYLNSTVRSRERGYLMWGAFHLSRAESASELAERLEELRRANASWGLRVPIEWGHPAGWRATREAAREMADVYEVVYASEGGARSSRHYDGEAVDLVAVGLPRRLRLRAPDAVEAEFDLSGAEESRDLSLTPRLIEWIEGHFALAKLRSDYPHWDDAVPRDR